MKKLSLQTKLYMLSLFLVSVSLFIGVIGYWSSSKTNAAYTVVTSTNMPNIIHLSEMMRRERSAILYAEHLASPGLSSAEKKETLEMVNSQWESFDKEDKEYNEVPFAPGEEDAYKPYKAATDEERAIIKSAFEKYNSAKVEDSKEFKEFEAIISGKLIPAFGKNRDTGNKIRNYHTDWSKRAVDEAHDFTKMGNTLSIASLLVGTVLGLLFSFFFSSNLVKTLRGISGALSDASAQVSSAAGQVASASQQLSQASTEQASSLEETAASIEEMSSMVAKNTENSRSAATKSDEALTGTNKGKSSVDQMINSMRDINESNAQIGEIVKVIREIDSKTKVINDIVFQTKLLSFNASVEAARAGEHGKGFAVVAEEVGNLAAMSGGAAEEISSLLESSIQKVESIAGLTKTKVEGGTVVAQDCGSVLDDIVKSVTSVTKMAGEISSACTEQSQGVQEITKAMNQLDQMTQQNAATSEEAASAAEELSAQAESLNSLVRTLTQAVEGGSSNEVTQEAPARTKATAPAARGEAKVVRIPRKDQKAQAA